MRVTRSGPKRFEYDTDDKKWYEVPVMDGVKNCRQVKEDINSLLTKEMKSLVGADLKFSRVCSETSWRCDSESDTVRVARQRIEHGEQFRFDRADAEAHEKATWCVADPLLRSVHHSGGYVIPAPIRKRQIQRNDGWRGSRAGVEGRRIGVDFQWLSLRCT